MKDTQSPVQDLAGASALEKIKKLAESARNCFFVTKVGSNSDSRPMALQGVDDEGILWFLSAKDSLKNKEVSEDPEVHLYFMNNSAYEYITVKGEAFITQDKEKIEQYWTNFANAWFDGKDDPNVTLIGVKAKEGYYYETKENKVFAMAKMLFAAATGSKTEDGGIEGELKL